MTRSLLLALMPALCTVVSGAFADESAADLETTAALDEEVKSYADVIEGDVVHEGLFTFYRDQESGAVTLSLGPQQFEKEYIYFIHIEDGVVDAGSFRGAYGPRFVFTLERRFDKVAIVRENTAFYFDPDNAISRASEANIARAVLAVQDIVAEDEETGAVLIEADSLFLSEAWTQLSPSRDPDADPRSEFTVGEFDAGKSQILNLRSYPLNTDIEVEYVFHNPKPLVYGSDAVTDPRNISVKALHSLIEMPENDYQPRFADPRLGSFNQRITDLTSTESAPYRDVINRWHLVKKDPEAALSDPVEPITWWIENTTPVDWRPIIEASALEWNKAFEKAGFTNAVAVKTQPDDADWDAGDLRYNVLRWTSSPNPPFGGYGPSFANPRTGQLLGADIMLEYSFLNRSTLARELIQSSNSSLSQGMTYKKALRITDANYLRQRRVYEIGLTLLLVLTLPISFLMAQVIGRGKGWRLWLSSAGKLLSGKRTLIGYSTALGEKFSLPQMPQPIFDICRELPQELDFSQNARALAEDYAKEAALRSDLLRLWQLTKCTTP